MSLLPRSPGSKNYSEAFKLFTMSFLSSSTFVGYLSFFWGSFSLKPKEFSKMHLVKYLLIHVFVVLLHFLIIVWLQVAWNGTTGYILHPFYRAHVPEAWFDFFFFLNSCKYLCALFRILSFQFSQHLSLFFSPECCFPVYISPSSMYLMFFVNFGYSLLNSFVCIGVLLVVPAMCPDTLMSQPWPPCPYRSRQRLWKEVFLLWLFHRHCPGSMLTGTWVESKILSLSSNFAWFFLSFIISDSFHSSF